MQARKHKHAPFRVVEHKAGHHKMPYLQLASMIGAHFLVMYAVMYSMVHTSADVFLNLNNVYMTAAMAAPMAALMLIFMRSMYPNQRINMAIYAGTAVLTVLFVLFTRQQTFVGDKQFVRSMVPHHSGAILMCERASITDSELQALCAQIIQGQRAEIEQMKAILQRL